MLTSRIRQHGGPLVLDGGLAGELETRGHDLAHALWSARLLAEEPRSIVSVTRDFAEAGADILATATYQASLPGFERAGFGRARAEQFFRDAVDLTRSVADALPHRPLVAASLGPYGAFLADGSEYRGKYGVPRETLAAFHRERIALLADTAADCYAFETFPSGDEAVLISELLAEFPPRDAWISCSCRNEAELWDGTPIGEVAAAVAESPHVQAFGVNCVDPAHAAALIERIREAAPRLAVIVYPNAGQGWDVASGRWKGCDTPSRFAARAQAWWEAGASIIGGCCLAGPDHIRALATRDWPPRPARS